MLNNVLKIKDCCNKGYTYLPYLWIFGLKIKDMCLSLGYWLKNSKAWKIGIAHIVRIWAI